MEPTRIPQCLGWGGVGETGALNLRQETPLEAVAWVGSNSGPCAENLSKIPLPAPGVFSPPPWRLSFSLGRLNAKAVQIQELYP